MRLHLFSSLLTIFCSLQSVHVLAQDSHFSAPIINLKGDVIGQLTAREGTKGVILRVTVEKMTSGLHGMHFHKVGNCSDTHHFKTAEGHIDPYTKPHGYFHPEGPHEGNLPNLIVAENGKADVEIYTEMVSLNKNDKKKQSLIDADGSSLIIHANPDDHVSQPIGGSGDRIACGLIKSKY